MQIRVIAFVFILLFPVAAMAQNNGGVSYGVSVSGPVTPNDCVKFQSPWVIQDAGTTCGGGSGGVSSITGDGILFSNSASTGAVTLTQATAGADTVFGNPTSGAATPIFTSSPVVSGISTASSFNATTPATGYQMNGANGISYPSVDSTVDGTIAIGSQAFANPSTSAAYNSVAIGEQALSGALTTAAIKNVAIGFQAGNGITSGNSNTFVGWGAGGVSATNGSGTAIGAAALATGGGSFAGGAAANAAGNDQVVIGLSASGASGQNDTVSIGHSAVCDGFSACVGSGVGKSGMNGNTSAIFGAQSGTALTSGAANAMFGFQAGTAVTTGSRNVILGNHVGDTTLTTGSNNILIGTNSGVDVQTAASTGTLNIGNVIYGTGLGTSGTTSAGVIGIGTATIQNSAKLQVNGTIETGVTGSTLGSILLAGSTSGLITEQPQAAAGTYNFNLPITAGTAGQLLTSQGGSSTAMTWSTGLTGSGGTPTCGTGCASITAGSTDIRGSMVSSSSVSSVTLNFSGTLASAPFCTISDSNSTAVADISSLTTSALTVSLASALTSVTIYWVCPQ